MVKVKSGKRIFFCDSKDEIMWNGACYQLITQHYLKNWSYLIPLISKSEFNRLQKLRVFEEPVKRKEVKFGITFVSTIYKFK